MSISAKELIALRRANREKQAAKLQHDTEAITPERSLKKPDVKGCSQAASRRLPFSAAGATATVTAATPPQQSPSAPGGWAGATGAEGGSCSRPPPHVETKSVLPSRSGWPSERCSEAIEVLGLGSGGAVASSMEPKVFAASVLITGELPRWEQVRRKRAWYDTFLLENGLDIEAMLGSRGVVLYRDASNREEGMLHSLLPLEGFDDYSSDELQCDDWIAKISEALPGSNAPSKNSVSLRAGQFTQLEPCTRGPKRSRCSSLCDGASKTPGQELVAMAPRGLAADVQRPGSRKTPGLPCLGLRREDGPKPTWELGNVVSWEKETNRLTVEWHDTRKRVELPRVYVMLLAECPERFVKRLVDAFQRRQNAERLLNRDLYVNCMPMDTYQSLDPAVAARIRRMSLATPKLRLGESCLDIGSLLQSVSTDYGRTMSLVLLEHVVRYGGMSRFLRDAPLPSPPPLHVLGAAGESSSALSTTVGSVQQIPSNGLVSIRGSDFFRMAKKVQAASFLHRQVPTRLLLQRVAATHDELLKTSLFIVAPALCDELPLGLSDFDELQTHATHESTQRIRDRWSIGIQGHIKVTLADTTAADDVYFHVRSKSEYEGSKLQRLITCIELQMEDTLHHYVSQSCEAFVRFLERAANYTVTVNSINDVAVTNDGPFSPGPPRWGYDYRAWLESETAVLSPHGSLFSVMLSVNDGKVAYTTALNEFWPVILSVFRRALNVHSKVPRIEPLLFDFVYCPVTQFVKTVSVDDPIAVDWIDRIERVVAHAIAPLQKYLETYEPFNDLIAIDVDEFVEKFALTVHKAKEAQAVIVEQLEWEKRVTQSIPRELHFGLFHVSCEKFKRRLISKCNQLVQRLLDELVLRSRSKAEEIDEKFSAIRDTLNAPTETPEDVVKAKEYIRSIPEQLLDLQALIADMNSVNEVLDFFQRPLKDEDFARKWQAIAWPLQLDEEVMRANRELEQVTRSLIVSINKELEAFAKEVEAMRRTVSGFYFYTDPRNAAEIAAETRRTLVQIQKFRDQANLFNIHQSLLNLEKTDFSDVRKLSADFEPFATLWLTVDDWGKWFEKWNTEPFLSIDAVQMAENVQTAYKNMIKVCREPRFRDRPAILSIAEDIRASIDQFEPIVPILRFLRTDGMKERHWEQISKELGFEVRPGVNLSLLEDVYTLKLDRYDEVLSRISEVAARENDIQNSLAKMRNAWAGMRLDVRSYKDTGCFVVPKEVIDETQELLDDQMLVTQGLSFSPFKKIFEDQIATWEASLKLVQQILDEWLTCQRAWLYLEPIFQSEDIARQLPAEHQRFQQVNKNWRFLTNKAHEIGLAMDFCTQTEGCLQLFKESNEHLEKVQRGLNQYLENKRSSFARFYFLSDDELLTILSEAKDPQCIQPHFRKLFESIAKIEMRAPDNEMLGMYSQMKEYIPFADSVYPRKYVENWLTEIEAMMKRSIRGHLAQGMKDYAAMSRKDFVLTAPGQIAIAVSQVMWTHECEESLTKHGSLEGYVPKANENLMVLVETVRQQLTSLQRMNLSGLITIEVHARDIVERLAAERVSSVFAFDWVSQLRSYWEQGNCYLRQVEAQFAYGGEYLGNTTRLVITPLTDRIYLTLTGAMHMFLGGAPAGPAGTGKTETVKDLAKAVAKQCVVFNCQEGMTYASMGKFFKGLAQAGAWACFDEFNRIDVEVLSVVAQQVSSLQEAGRTKQYRIPFEGVEIVVDPSHSVFITMNPGYAGRTELPDNLKVLFRPVACMVPDYAMIAEIRLFSYGYANSRKLAQKMAATFRLSSEQLSSQDHYDFGMRAVNTVISAAGLMKREHPDDPEDVLLLRALRDSNAPKFLDEDLMLFNGIVSDLFPGVAVPPFDYGAFLAALRDKALEMHLQPTNLFLKKCVQLYEMSILRHGQMSVGPAMGGKTSATRVLQAAMGHLKRSQSDTRFVEVKTYCLNPKAITMAQLYGGFDEATGEWRDGIVGELFRIAARDTTDDRQWIIFDGPVDALWIESMNTVLDENKKLCLISGEIIAMTPNMNVWFEVEDLAVASPATVSRAGMIYMEPQTCIGVESFIQSWVMFELPSTMNAYCDELRDICAALFPSLIDFVQTTVVEYNPTVWPNLLRSCFRIFNAFVAPFTPTRTEDVPPDRLDTLRRAYMHFLIFSIVWSFGASGDSASRNHFDSFLREELANRHVNVELPTVGILHDYEFVTEECKWVLWTERIPAFNSVVTRANYADIIVPTADVARYSFVSRHLLTHSNHILLCGPTGTGKTVILQQLLFNNMPKEFTPILFTFSARTSANQTQDLLFSKFEVRRRASPQIWGPPISKKFVILVDDVNMPQKEQYGAQPPIEILRQYLDYEGWYDRKTREFFHIVDIVLAGAMGPPGGGRNRITDRFARHFNLIACPEIDNENMKLIFGSVLSSFMKSFSEGIRSEISAIVESSIVTFNTVCKELRPTPSRPHYLFNLRDVAKVIGGLINADPQRVVSADDLLRLWLHELMRTFRDRLVSNDDRGWFDNLLKKQLQWHFKKNWNDVVAEERPLLFTDVISASTDARHYEEVTDLTALVAVIQARLDDYNRLTTKKMDLVLFLDAVEHVIRIANIIRKPNGHALLLGVGGSGRQSLSRLAAFLNDFATFQVEITKGYSMNTWREDVKMVLRKCAFQNKQVLFLFADTQIAHEAMLEDLNNLLNVGEVPNLFVGPDVDEILAAMKPVCVAEGLPLDKVNMYARFVKFCRSNLHISLCMSPLGEPFRNRLRMFPALVNCATIDWFSAWPEQALIRVATDFFAKRPIAEDRALMDACALMSVYIHQTVEQMSLSFLEETKRYNYVTPTSYLELLHTFQTIFTDEMRLVHTTKHRLQNGLEKLRETEEAVAGLQTTLEKNQPILVEKGESIKKLVAEMQVQTEAAKETQREAEQEEKAAADKQYECSLIEQEAQSQLAEALPELDRALESLKNLKSSQITEVAGYKAPTPGVVMTMQGMCILFQIKPVMRAANPMEEKKPDYWATAKEQLLNNPGNLLQRLIGYDKEHIPEKLIQTVIPLVKSEDFTPKKIAGASQACAAMCQWTHAMVKFHEVNKKVEPLRQQLAVAQQDSRIFKEKLDIARRRLEEVNASLARLQSDREKAELEMEDLQRTVQATEVKLGRAALLIDGLAGEKKNWGLSVASLTEKEKYLVGDMLAAAGQVAYLGSFTSHYRVKILEQWEKRLAQLGIRHSVQLSVYHTINDPIQARSWFAHGLPTDSVSVENALFISKARRWPLMIDPQTQANRWIRNTFGSQLEVLKPNQKDVIKRIEYCLRAGRAVLLENVSQEIDPSLDPLLCKQTFMEGGQEMIRISENPVPWNENFRFFMTTKLPNPHYTPEVMVKVTLLNFFITPSGLEEQLLGVIVGQERKELEIHRSDLIQRNAEMRAEVDSIQKTILKNLEEVLGDILDDEGLIQYLNQSKTKTAEIHQKVEEAETAEREINVTREGYRPIAAHSAILYFCCATLSALDPMYQYSLQWFVQLFIRGIEAAATSDNLEQRLENLREYFTYSFYQNISRSLFEKHKTTFSFFLCVRLLQSKGLLVDEELRFLLQGPSSSASGSGGTRRNQLPNPAPEWLIESTWNELCSLEQTLTAFSGFTRHLSDNTDHYNRLFMSAVAHREPLSSSWQNKLTRMQKMLFLRCIRPDKLIDALLDFVSNEIGEKFIKPPPFDLPTSFLDSSPRSPLIFILSQGADPYEDWKKFAETQKMGKKLSDISLGQGQGPRAERLIREGMETGTWVLLQNCHLSTSWMPSLERIVESFSEDIHPSFRLWLTSMPSAQFPVAVLQNGVKMTNEPPKGIQANITRSVLNYSNDFLEGCKKEAEFKKLFFSMCLFHALVQERRKFGPLGWNIPYEYTSGDLGCCVTQIRMFLNKYDEVPYRVIKELSGHIHYGGRVTDDWDRRTLTTMLEGFVTPDVMKDGYTFSLSGIYNSIPATDQQGYLAYIATWPINPHPEVFGLHENADIACARSESFETLNAVFLLQGGAQGSSSSSSKSKQTTTNHDSESIDAQATSPSTPDDIVNGIAGSILRELRSPFNIEEFQERFPTRYEDSMNTVLVQEAIRFNRVLSVMHSTLETLPLAIKGEVVMSKEMEDIYNALFSNKVPAAWSEKAYPSLRPLASWVADLQRRLEMIDDWYENGHPLTYWISGFFFPQAFLTGILQNYARKSKISIDSITYGYEWLNMAPMDVVAPPDTGCYIHGMYIEGARIDSESLKLVESRPKVLYEPTPMLWLVPQSSSLGHDQGGEQDLRDPSRPHPHVTYKCPLYKTLRRAGTLSTTGHSTNYVLAAEIPTDEDPSHWVKRGVAMLCSLSS